MTQQPEALRLADAIDPFVRKSAPEHLTSTVAAAELRRLHNLCAEWEKKAETWIASPEAAKRLDGYRELAQRVDTLDAALRQAVEALESVYGKGKRCEAAITAAKQALEGSMTDRELMQQTLETLELLAKLEHPASNITTKTGGRIYPHKVAKNAAALLRERLAQEPNMPEQHVMIGRFMLQPHPENGYWLTDTGTCEAMQIFQPEMEQVIKKLWGQF